MHHIFDEINVGSMKLKNRIMMPALNLRYCPGGEINQRIIDFYERRAAGGVGLIVVGRCEIEEPSYNESVGIGDDRYVEGLSRLTTTLHKRDTKVAAQLGHQGRYVTTRPALAPSAVRYGRANHPPRAMTKEDIKSIISLFGQAASRAKAAGFDAIEILGSAGYLVSQFLSPLTNLRTDEYGGNYKNRMRFGIELTEHLRAIIGRDYPLIFRVSGHDFMPGGSTSSEAAEFCKALEEAGIDGFNVTGGWHESRVPQITMQVPRGAMVYLARGIKEAVGVPVIACNRITTPELAEQIVSNRDADMVGVARVLVADPDWPYKAMQGQSDTIRPCIACNQGCLDYTFSNRPMACLVNSEVGEEIAQKIVLTSHKKRVLVIGGGPAGLECARVAAERGHSVTLWEKREDIGGQLILAARTPGRDEWRSLIEYYRTACNRAGVIFELGKEATPEAVREFAPEELIIATGAIPDSSVIIPGAELAVQSWDILQGKAEVGQHVVVIGAGATGCETALFIARKGNMSNDVAAFFIRYNGETLDKLSSSLNIGTPNVTIIESGPEPGQSIGLSTKWVVLQDLAKAGVAILPDTNVLKINQDCVEIERYGKHQILAADTVVLATGVRSNNLMNSEWQRIVAKAYVIGDAQSPRNALTAIHEGYSIGNKI